MQLRVVRVMVVVETRMRPVGRCSFVRGRGFEEVDRLQIPFH
jgi:hypothetical protein